MRASPRSCACRRSRRSSRARRWSPKSPPRPRNSPRSCAGTTLRTRPSSSLRAQRRIEPAKAAVLQLKKLSRDFALEASGVDLAQPLSDGAFREIEEAFFAGQVLVLRGQKLTAREFLEFARRFGPPEPHVVDQFHHPEYADILILSNVVRDGQPAGLADAGTYFHTDYSYLDMPARATLLYSIQVPKVGGDTLFADQYAAYDGLPDSLKKKIENLVALHHYGNRDDLDKSSRTVASVLSQEQEQKMTWVRHRVARKHPVT